ncbi:MAG: hypothetical protein LC744_08920 [Chloroflexi bacterium]|nr:hypothetical protein [Chloroflexota bacterium]
MPTRITATIDPARSRTDARTEDGETISMDAHAPEGDGSAPGPKETVLAALAACTGMGWTS